MICASCLKVQGCTRESGNKCRTKGSASMDAPFVQIAIDDNSELSDTTVWALDSLGQVWVLSHHAGDDGSSTAWMLTDYPRNAKTRVR